MAIWNIIRPNEGVGGPNLFCTEDTLANFQRLLKVKTSRDIYSPQNEEADAHLILNGHSSSYKEQLAFARRVRANGKKVVLGFSADGRWTNGGALADITSGLNYADILEESDAIISEVNTNWRVYGRFQNKVVPVSEPLEHFKFESNKEKDIDVLLVGSAGGNHICYAIEACNMLLQRNPSYRCLIGMGENYRAAFSKQNPKIGMEVTGPHHVFTKYLKRTKVLVNIEMKPRGGRSVIWGYYAGIPVVCASGAFYSKLYPELVFDRIDLDQIVDLTILALNDSERIMVQAIELAKPYYFPEWKKTLYSALGLENE